MITLAIDEVQRRFFSLCHQLVESGEVCVVQENGRTLARLTPERAEEAPRQASILEDLAEWERTHPNEEDHDDSFVETWKLRGVMDAQADASPRF